MKSSATDAPGPTRRHLLSLTAGNPTAEGETAMPSRLPTSTGKCLSTGQGRVAAAEVDAHEHGAAPHLTAGAQPSVPPPILPSHMISYVRCRLASAGVRSLPIRYDATPEEVKPILDGVNGLLLPGGTTPRASSVRQVRRQHRLRSGRLCSLVIRVYTWSL